MEDDTPTERRIVEVERQLLRGGARCRVLTKMKPRGRWCEYGKSLKKLSDAMLVARRIDEECAQVAIFLEHCKFDGILVWKSDEKDVLNDFGDIFPEIL